MRFVLDLMVGLLLAGLAMLGVVIIMAVTMSPTITANWWFVGIGAGGAGLTAWVALRYAADREDGLAESLRRMSWFPISTSLFGLLAVVNLFLLLRPEPPLR